MILNSPFLDSPQPIQWQILSSQPLKYMLLLPSSLYCHLLPDKLLSVLSDSLLVVTSFSVQQRDSEKCKSVHITTLLRTFRWLPITFEIKPKSLPWPSRPAWPGPLLSSPTCPHLVCSSDTFTMILEHAKLFPYQGLLHLLPVHSPLPARPQDTLLSDLCKSH